MLIMLTQRHEYSGIDSKQRIDQDLDPFYHFKLEKSCLWRGLIAEA